MKETVLICCLGCGHKHVVDREWLRQFQPGLESSTKQTLIRALRAIYNNLVCKQCGKQEIKLIELAQNGSKNPDGQASSESKLRFKRDQKALESLMHNAWLYPNEMALLKDFQKQVEKGKRLSGKQLRTIARIKQRIHSGYRQLPKIFRG